MQQDGLLHTSLSPLMNERHSVLGEGLRCGDDVNSASGYEINAAKFGSVFPPESSVGDV